MNRQQRRSAGRARKAALALLVAGALASGTVGDFTALAAGDELSISGGQGGYYGCGSPLSYPGEVKLDGSTLIAGFQDPITVSYDTPTPPPFNGGKATVSVGTYSIDSLLLFGGVGSSESDAAGNGGDAVINVSGTLTCADIALEGGENDSYGTGGFARLNATTLAVKEGDSLTLANSPRVDINVGTFAFDISGGKDKILLEATDESFNLTWLSRSNITLTLGGATFDLEDSTILIQNVAGSFSRNLSAGGEKFVVSVKEGNLIATRHDWTSGGGGPYVPPLPPVDPEPTTNGGDDDDDGGDDDPTVTILTDGDLDSLFANAIDGVMFLNIPGELDKLQIVVPLKWFMENLGATLLVYNEGIGAMAITSENMIELAALSYTGEGGVTVEMHGKEFTFNPETLITYIAEKGSVILSVASEGNSLVWYVYDSPLILGLPGGADSDDWVAYRRMSDGSEKIMPRSLLRDGLVFTLVNEEGTYDIKSNPMTFDDVAGHWMENAAKFMAARGIMIGYDGEFSPDRLITRAEYTTMLMRSMDYKSDENAPMPFSDVDTGIWYYESAKAAAALGITSGRGDGTFGPRDVITREEMFVMTYDALKYFYLIIPDEENLGAAETFSDASDITPDALEAVSELIANGLVAGYDGALNIQGNLTRAEAAQFLTNVIRYIVPDYTEILKTASGSARG